MIRTTFGGQRYYYPSQDLEKEYLLCPECEQHLGESENYLRVLCRGLPAAMIKRGVQVEGGGRLHGVDAALVLRALLGIALKAHLCSGVALRTFALQDAELVHVRDAIMTDSYDAGRYDVHAIKWMDFKNSGLHSRDLAGASAADQLGTTYVRVDVGGVCFQFGLGSRETSDVSHLLALPDMRLRANRPWFWMVGDPTDNTMFETQAHRFEHLRTRGAFAIGPDEPCPCHPTPPAAYGECCRFAWYPSGSGPAWTLALRDPQHECEVGTGSPLCDVARTLARPSDHPSQRLQVYLDMKRPGVARAEQRGP